MRVTYDCYCLIGFCLFFVMVADVRRVNAEIYQYTDNQGIIHFTDNPQNIPASIRSKSMREVPSSLSSQDNKIIGELMKRGHIERDLQFSNPKEMKEGVNFLRESVRKELVDPEELDKPLDPRLSSPEGAIDLYRAALRAGNMRDLKACLTNSYWENMKPEFIAMGKQKMAEIEKDIFSHAVIKKIKQDDTHAKFEILKLEGSKKMSYPILIENAFGNWKIDNL